MTKRYKGGLISSTAASPFTGGIWSLAEHIQGTKASAWPTRSAIAQTGSTTYDATGVGPVSDISELASNTEVMGILPGSGYLRYNLNVGASVNAITVSYRKASSNTLVQSAFSLFGSALAYVDASASTILYGANDDHDSLFMDADGRGVLARFNTNNISATGNWTKFAGTTTIVADNVIDVVVTYPVTSFISSGQVGSIVSFPLTNSSVWINLTSGTYKVNGFTGGSLPALAVGIGTGAATNSLYTISDGVSSFIMGRFGTTAAGYYKVNLVTGAITGTSFVYDVTPTLPGTGGAADGQTEEDAIGAQFFTVDCFNTYMNGLSVNYGGTNHWLTTAEPFGTTGKSSFVAGPGATNTTAAINQIGRDIFGSIDPSDRSVWFADWGHDGGGLYNVADDTELGTRKTNIKLIPTTYTN